MTSPNPTTDLILLPVPQRVKHLDGHLNIAGGGSIWIPEDAAALLPIAKHLEQALTGWRLVVAPHPVPGEASITIQVDKHADIPAEGYNLHVSSAGIQIAAATSAGAFYGGMTLIQILRQCENEISALAIEDWPDLASRGVMLDISRDKVPTLDTLFMLVDQLAEWKINHLELYTEHTFAYQNHRDAWEQASPMTAEDIRTLDLFCRDRFVELVPNQNSLGHMARWLELPRYRHLAECPDGFTMPNSTHRGPWSLAPLSPESMTFMNALYDELLPNFTSRKINIGCDETWDIGLGKSQGECERLGRGQVFLNYLNKVGAELAGRGFAAHFWADMFFNNFPELLADVDRRMVAVDWGYYRSYPFAEHARTMAREGVEFICASGTSSWTNVLGCNDAAFGSNRTAAEAAATHGGQGVLNTDWGDNGHHQYLSISLVPFAAGAAVSWSHHTNSDETICAALDLHVFHDRAGVMGAVAYDLADIWQYAGRGTTTSQDLKNILLQNDLPITDGVSVGTLRDTEDRVCGILNRMAQADMGRGDGDLVKAEFVNAVRMTVHACRRASAMLGGTIGDHEVCRELAEDNRDIVAEHRRLWLARNREGGLRDSVARLVWTGTEP